MGIDENASETFYAEPLDEAHPAHVGGQVIDFDRAVTHPPAGFLVATIEMQILHPWDAQVPVVKWLLVHRPDPREAPFVEVCRQIASDETAGTGDGDEVVFPQFGFHPVAPYVFHTLPFKWLPVVLVHLQDVAGRFSHASIPARTTPRSSQLGLDSFGGR